MFALVLIRYIDKMETVPTLMTMSLDQALAAESDKKRKNQVSFEFRKKREAINWRLLASVNVEKIVREV